MLHDFVSIQCIQHIANGLKRVKRVGADKVTCLCFIRTTHGLPCACELSNLQTQGYHIPLEIIHVFWRILYFEEYEVIEEGGEAQLDIYKEREELKRYFNNLDIFR